MIVLSFLKKNTLQNGHCRAWQIASQDSIKKTDILGHVPCSILPQKDCNIDLRDTSRTCAGLVQPELISVFNSYSQSTFMNNS